MSILYFIKCRHLCLSFQFNSTRGFLVQTYDFFFEIFLVIFFCFCEKKEIKQYGDCVSRERNIYFRYRTNKLVLFSYKTRKRNFFFELKFIFKYNDINEKWFFSSIIIRRKKSIVFLLFLIF
jgi:hypothetical protein